jgi:hypothetical protein
MKQYTGYSGNASLALVAEWTNANHIWEELEAQVKIHQKTVKYRPSDKLKDLLINIWAGGEVTLIILNQTHNLARVFQQTWLTCFARDDLPFILGKI